MQMAQTEINERRIRSAMITRLFTSRQKQECSNNVFGDLMICENKQGNQLPGVLFVLV